MRLRDLFEVEYTDIGLPRNTSLARSRAGRKTFPQYDVKPKSSSGALGNIDPAAPASLTPPAAVNEPPLSSGGSYGINRNPETNPLFSLNGTHSTMTKPEAGTNMSRLLAGPYARMQEYYGGPVMINDAIAKRGTSRESSTQGSQHFLGLALDLNIVGLTNEQKNRLFYAARRAGFTGFGFGERTLHVDLGPSRAWSYGPTYAGQPVNIYQSLARGVA